MRQGGMWSWQQPASATHCEDGGSALLARWICKAKPNLAEQPPAHGVVRRSVWLWDGGSYAWCGSQLQGQIGLLVLLRAACKLHPKPQAGMNWGPRCSLDRGGALQVLHDREIIPDSEKPLIVARSCPPPVHVQITFLPGANEECCMLHYTRPLCRVPFRAVGGWVCPPPPWVAEFLEVPKRIFGEIVQLETSNPDHGREVSGFLHFMNIDAMSTS